MERKPQQQTLSIRVSDALREFLERSKHVISGVRGESVSTSDVAKILLESAKDDRLDDRLETAELGRKPTESMVNIRRKWESGHPRSRAEWIFMAQYIQVATEELSEDPMAPGAERMIDLLRALVAVRSLRAEFDPDLDRYYIGNLFDQGKWNEQTLDADALSELVNKLIEEIRASGNGKRAVFAGRNFYVAVRDEELRETVALNAVLDPLMPTLFRMAARGHWMREQRPVRRLRDGSVLLGSVDRTRMGNLWISVQPGQTDVSLLIGFDARDVIYTVSTYAQIREFNAMLKAVKFGQRWKGEHFFSFAHEASAEGPAYYQFRRETDGVTLSFSEVQWAELQTIYVRVMEKPEMKAIFEELSWIYGDL
jgi:hypothetical protein